VILLAVRWYLRYPLAGFIAKFVEANGEAMNRGEVTLAMLGGDAE
jgi:hypothetical protein